MHMIVAFCPPAAQAENPEGSAKRDVTCAGTAQMW